MKLVLDLNESEAKFLKALVKTGLYGRTPAQAALRLLDEALEPKVRRTRDGTPK